MDQTSDTTAVSEARSGFSRASAWLVGVSAVVVVADQVVKAVIRRVLEVGESVPVIPDLVWITHVRNAGAAFGMLQGGRPFFIITGVIVLTSLGVYWRRAHSDSATLAVTLGLIAGGALGNLIDRAATGLVTDFLEVPNFPVFNVADSAIVVGVAALAWRIILEPQPEGDVE